MRDESDITIDPFTWGSKFGTIEVHRYDHEHGDVDDFARDYILTFVNDTYPRGIILGYVTDDEGTYEPCFEPGYSGVLWEASILRDIADMMDEMDKRLKAAREAAK